MLDVAFDLFHEKGIHATGVDEVLTRSDTGKSQLYHYFGSKDGLIRAVVLDFEERLANHELPGTGEIQSVKDLERWFGMFVQFQRDTGSRRTCPMATVAMGLTVEQEPIREVIERIFENARGVLLRFFQDFAQKKKLPPKASPDELADFCYAIMQGGLVISKVRRDPRPFEHAVKHALAYVRSVMT